MCNYNKEYVLNKDSIYDLEDEQPDFPTDEADPSTYDNPEYLRQSCTLSDNDNPERKESYFSEKEEGSTKKSS